jgi:antitoxin component HigA of HigAB toxin-antitoxin module
MGRSMIATAVKGDTRAGFDTLKPIPCDAQNERFISALLEMERPSKLTAGEKMYAEALDRLLEGNQEKHCAVRATSPVKVLAERTSAGKLEQKELASRLGSASIDSEILGGRRELGRRPVERPSKRFKVSAEVFFEILAEKLSWDIS